MNFREAMLQARSGKTVTRAGKIVRHLTKEEADAHQHTYSPSRRVVHETVKVKDAEGKEHEQHQPVVKDGKLVIEEHGDIGRRPQKLGLFDVSQQDESGHALSYQPSEDDMYKPIELDEEGKEKPRELQSDWELVQSEPDPAAEPDPEAVAPETVDTMLTEQPPHPTDDELEGDPHVFRDRGDG